MIPNNNRWLAISCKQSLLTIINWLTSGILTILLVKLKYSYCLFNIVIKILLSLQKTNKNVNASVGVCIKCLRWRSRWITRYSTSIPSCLTLECCSTKNAHRSTRLSVLDYCLWRIRRSCDSSSCSTKLRECGERDRKPPVKPLKLSIISVRKLTLKVTGWLSHYLLLRLYQRSSWRQHYYTVMEIATGTTY